MSRKLFEEVQKVLRQNQQPVTEAAVKLDLVGQEDKDVDNDGDSDKTDSYLKKRRGAISAAIAGSKKTMVAKESVDETTTNKILAILGKPMQEEVVSESDLPTTKKPQKTITVKHETSEREKVIADTPEARKKNAAMGYHPVKEEAEQIDELSKNLLNRYTKAARQDQKIALKKDTALGAEQKKINNMMANTTNGSNADREYADAEKTYFKNPTRKTWKDLGAAQMRFKRDSNPISKKNAPKVHKALTKASAEIEKMREPIQARYGKRMSGIELATKKMGQGPGSRSVVKGTGKLTSEDIDNAPVSEILEQVDAFTIDLPNPLSYEDYLHTAMFAEGVSSLSELEDDFLPKFLQYVQERFESGDEDFVISELTYSEMQNRIYMHQKQGNKVTGVERKTLNGKPYAAYVVTDKTGMRRRYIYHGNVRRVENLGQGSASQTVKPGQTDPNEE